MKCSTVRITIHSLCIIALSVLYCELMPYDLSNVPDFGASVNLDITDFYNSIANERVVSKCDSNIVLVDVGLADRGEMAEALELISDCEPRAIGLDVIFDLPKDKYEDSCLIRSIQCVDNLVVASSLDNSKKSFFDNLIPENKKGYAELGDANNVIRQFYPESPCGADTLHSFASQIVRLSGIITKRQSHNGDYIIYPSIEYDTLHIDEIEESHERLNGKLVLIGTLASNEDIFYTPTDLRMNGVCVHAHILSTMLSDKGIAYLGKPIQWIVAIVIIFALIFLRVYFMLGENAMGDFILRITQLFVVWLFVYISYLLFIHFLLYCDLSIALLSCISLFVADVWQAGLYVYKKIAEWVSLKKSHTKT